MRFFEGIATNNQRECSFLSVLVVLALEASATPPPHVLFIVGDDVRYADIGLFNNEKVHTPELNQLLKEGIFMSDYYTFKIYSPSRAAMMTGRYPAADFMSTSLG